MMGNKSPAVSPARRLSLTSPSSSRSNSVSASVSNSPASTQRVVSSLSTLAISEGSQAVTPQSTSRTVRRRSSSSFSTPSVHSQGGNQLTTQHVNGRSPIPSPSLDIVKQRRASFSKSSLFSVSPSSTARLNAAMGERRGSLKIAKEAREDIDRALEQSKLKILEGKTEANTRGHMQHLLRHHNVSELVLPDVIVVNATDQPVQAFETLLRNNIMSAPVLDSETKTYTGLLDVKDLVSSIIHAYSMETVPQDIFNEAIVHALSQHSPKHTNISCNSNNNNRCGSPLASSSVTPATSAPSHMGVSVAYLSRRNPFKPVKLTASLYEVAKRISEPHIHRVPVVNDEGVCISMISQSVLLAFIVKHLPTLKDETRLTLRQLNLGFRDVVHVFEADTALTAFATLDQANLSGIAVVSKDLRLTGNTSARDIKYFMLDRGKIPMHLPIIQYLSQIRQQDLKEQCLSCHVRETATLSKVIKILAATKFHRVFITDKADRLIGVISITDIFRVVTNYGLR